MVAKTEIVRYRAALRLDPDGSDLPEAASRQSNQHEEIYRAYVYAKSRAAEAKTDLDDFIAAGVRDLRGQAGNSKKTVTDLKAIVSGQEAYSVRVRKKAEADLEVELWKGVRESSRQRRDMIEVMSQLLIQGHITPGAHFGSRPDPADAKARYSKQREQMFARSAKRKQNEDG